MDEIHKVGKKEAEPGVGYDGGERMWGGVWWAGVQIMKGDSLIGH